MRNLHSTDVREMWYGKADTRLERIVDDDGNVTYRVVIFSIFDNTFDFIEIDIKFGYRMVGGICPILCDDIN